jgi:hypothetical protein
MSSSACSMLMLRKVAHLVRLAAGNARAILRTAIVGVVGHCHSPSLVESASGLVSGIVLTQIKFRSVWR